MARPHPRKPRSSGRPGRTSGGRPARGNDASRPASPRPRASTPSARTGRAGAGQRAVPTSGLHRWSAPLLVRLHALPRWLVPILLAALLLAGFALEGIPAALCLLAVGAFLGWLLLLSWPLLSPTSKAVRTIVVGVVLAVAVQESGLLP